jgi:hypothetical protein
MTADLPRADRGGSRGGDALSKYDREIAHGADDELAWASAVAIKFSHISQCR